jgi:hypothetical protein
MAKLEHFITPVTCPECALMALQRGKRMKREI